MWKGVNVVGLFWCYLMEGVLVPPLIVYPGDGDVSVVDVFCCYSVLGVNAPPTHPLSALVMGL